VDVTQSSLNGENEAVRKAAAVGENYAARDPDDFMDPHRCFRGSVVEDGEGVLRVDAVGGATIAVPPAALARLTLRRAGWRLS
jgi:hypothetical protein